MPDRDDLITQNMGLVYACAHRFKGRGIEYEDLCQVGCLGLIKAVDGFDESRGLQFSTYAVPTILGEIKRLFRDGGAIKVSRRLKTLSLQASRAKSQLENRWGREVTVSELAQSMGVDEEELTEALCATHPVQSLTVTDDNGETQELAVVVDDSDAVNDRLLADELIRRLDENDRRLIALRYFSGLTQSETARALRMSQVQVSRREKKILAFLRGSSERAG